LCLFEDVEDYRLRSKHRLKIGSTVSAATDGRDNRSPEKVEIHAGTGGLEGAHPEQEGRQRVEHYRPGGGTKKKRGKGKRGSTPSLILE